MLNINCKDCLFYHPFTHESKNGDGDCRVTPPHAIGVEIFQTEKSDGLLIKTNTGVSGHIHGWASVKETDACKCWAPNSVDYRKLQEKNWNVEAPDPIEVHTDKMIDVMYDVRAHQALQQKYTTLEEKFKDLEAKLLVYKPI